MKTLILVILVPLVIQTLAVKTIYSLKELEIRGFNDRPRHGRALFLWLSLECLDKNMMAKCDPTRGEYGFHKFDNKEGLLPVIRDKQWYTYYTIGNLNNEHGRLLQQKIITYFNPEDPLSNMDRVVVRFNNYNRQIDEIYITAHYRPTETYRIYPGLIRNVQMSALLGSLLQLPSYRPSHPTRRSPLPRSGPSTPRGPSLLPESLPPPGSNPLLGSSQWLRSRNPRRTHQPSRPSQQPPLILGLQELSMASDLRSNLDHYSTSGDSRINNQGEAEEVLGTIEEDGVEYYDTDHLLSSQISESNRAEFTPTLFQHK